MISDLMVLLESGGFFHDNGLNSLPSINHICSLLNDPNFFKSVSAKNESLVSFVRKSKFSMRKCLIQVYLDNNRAEKESPSPIVGVEMYDGVGVYDSETCKLQKHAVVLKDYK